MRIKKGSALLTALAVVACLAATPRALADESAVAAQVGDWRLTLGELDRQLAGEIHELELKIHQLRVERVSQLLAERLLAMEAAAGQTTPEALMDQHLAGTTQITDEDVQRFIQQNAARLPNGGQGLEAQIKSHLQRMMQGEARGRYVAQLAEKHGAQINLPAPVPPRFTVRGPEDLAQGPADAPVTIVEFSDFQCPYCRQAQPTLTQLQNLYAGKIRLVFRHFPLPFHQLAPKAAEASQCAADQGGFWGYHDALFDSDDQPTMERLKQIAVDQRLDVGQFNACLDSGRHAARVAADLKEGERLGVSGTPAFFINGVRFVGAIPLETFKQAIDAELEQ